MELVFFYVLSFLILASAIAVIILPNPIHSTLSLIVTLTSVAAIFALMEAHFLATVQVIVYAGAIVVLVLFVLMLLNTKEEKIDKKPVILVLTIVAAVFMLSVFFPLLNDVFGGAKQLATDPRISGSAKSLGQLLYTQYTFPFELASLLIMAALVGAVMIGRSRNSEIDHLLADPTGKIQSTMKDKLMKESLENNSKEEK
ncbi:UNVERIFIED_CONTAM: hypothetical protein GTU68_066479 [Idotea baltica]|nr:hypothetical protein [Idotea baltica]